MKNIDYMGQSPEMKEKIRNANVHLENTNSYRMQLYNTKLELEKTKQLLSLTKVKLEETQLENIDLKSAIESLLEAFEIIEAKEKVNIHSKIIKAK